MAINNKVAELFGLSDCKSLENTVLANSALSEFTSWSCILDQFATTETATIDIDVKKQGGADISIRIEGAVNESAEYLDLSLTEHAVHPLVEAADQLSEAISIYDDADRRIYSNLTFRTQNAEIPDTSRLGATFEDYVRSLVNKGKIDEAEKDQERWVQERIKKHKNPKGAFVINRGDDGWMQVDEQRLLGGGTIVLSSDITSVKRTEIVEAESAARLRRIMSFSPIGAMIVDMEGHYLYVNEKGAEGFRLSRQQMEGRRSHDFYSNIEDRNEIIRLVNEQGYVNDFEALLKRVDGSTFWALISVYFDPDNRNQYITWYYDIDERQRAHQKLLQLSAAVEAMSEPVAVFDAEDRFVFTNETFRREAEKANHPPVIGKTFEDHMITVAYSGAIPDAIGREKEWVENRVKQHRNPTGPYEVIRNDGSHFQAVEKNLPGGGSVLPLTNVSEIKNASIELANAKDQAEIANRAKSEFLATISHELRTPLTSIKGSLGLLTGTMEHAFSADAYSLLEMAKRNSDTLLILINDLLDFEKILSGNMVLNNRIHDVGQVTADLLETIDGYAELQAVELLFEKPNTEIRAQLDKQRFEQVLRNLISNAAKFSNPGSSVIIQIEEFQTNVRASVTDTGIGIPAAEQARIFDRFTQVDSSDMRKQNGSGLGLPISKALVEGMGGTIGYKSQEGQGSTFYVELPCPGQT